MTRSKVLSISVCSVLLAVGCSTWQPTPGLPFPEKPELHGNLVEINSERMFCVPYDDAIALTHWMQELGAFKRSYEGW